ncbi:MAG: hypothetical protein A3C49_00690 [Candidatus Doudnabacteria bacterium RIFCSPHIGHO2_02_FULL_42_25]|uniref:Uncharacterized protein n=1 Tax=Candidatus Doudnabacteria bacterium RIFCSPHIGHO2_01_FULL_41_86 TaxID=1817821 RepID=A0A1F5N7T9_9BACT|nr:MAG: hypothetical protein A2717_03735 [Candidatus Doudnabacteria bacterium RIFCSPHIGHO2_01_FULL_41_86]OGE74784.1 MAG: hypothetical protein A3K07_03330 [Candidatus Doudnabacteria bacterium RIFCSPHIGHO2_01_43_10]OGE85751.1 MAG: hypothetical protein A3E28_03065 [Candidatus Doudnabacteria bacterium RIFCSPHIGHO2_12_FULL_42_22]OGE87246.1 MAG: hypothetical protein A3C49_00690 [Candidatus Doudnabacteria bacterium RIFCSPHIGHO2_02_FULL_42_25]OGE92083.1 MAG: hypothetical protein A2895_00565 [Candidatus
MYEFNSTANILIQSLIAIIIIGVFYNLMMSTKLYGGIIGKAVRLIGVATMLVAVASIENVLLKFKIVEHSLTASVFQDLLILVSLVLLGIAFSKLGSVNKQ